MSEDKPLSQVQDQLAKLNNHLDQYEKNVGLGGLNSTDVSWYLNLNQEKLRKMSPEDCAEGAYLLNQEATFIQHEINKHQAQIDWANARIKKTIAPNLQQFGGKFATNDTRETLAIKNDSYATELNDIVSKSQRFITRLSYIPSHLKAIASVLMDYKQTKMRQ